MKRSVFPIAIALGALLVAPAAAHVEASPSKAPADSVTRIVLRVEGEESVPAVKVVVQMPIGLTDVRFLPARGWKRAQSGRVVTWTGGRIPLEQFGRFPFVAHVPATPGKELRFPVIETYASGKVVRWIGAKSSDFPAAFLRLTGSKKAPPPPPPPPPPPTQAARTSGSTDGGNGLVYWIVGVGAAVVAAVGGLVLWRRKP